MKDFKTEFLKKIKKLCKTKKEAQCFAAGVDWCQKRLLALKNNI